MQDKASHPTQTRCLRRPEPQSKHTRSLLVCPIESNRPAPRSIDLRKPSIPLQRGWTPPGAVKKGNTRAQSCTPLRSSFSRLRPPFSKATAGREEEADQRANGAPAQQLFPLCSAVLAAPPVAESVDRLDDRCWGRRRVLVGSWSSLLGPLPPSVGWRWRARLAKPGERTHDDR